MRSRLVQMGSAALGVLAAVCALVGTATAATTAQAPEINANMIPAALGLVTAGVLMVRARRGSK
jgi:hypothetical protein